MFGVGLLDADEIGRASGFNRKSAGLSRMAAQLGAALLHLCFGTILIETGIL